MEILSRIVHLRRLIALKPRKANSTSNNSKTIKPVKIQVFPKVWTFFKFFSTKNYFRKNKPRKYEKLTFYTIKNEKL